MDVLKMIYPRRCPICDGILEKSSYLACPGCVQQLRPIREPLCKICGKQLSIQEEELCRDCRCTAHSFQAGRGIFPYDKKAHSSMMKYKHGGRREYERFYEKALLLYGEPWLRQCRPQVLIPIPMRRQDMRRRGFYPAGNLARSLGEACQIPVAWKLLSKVKKTKPQKELDQKSRKRNLKNAFQGYPGPWGITRAMLIDDVYTTGSTMDEAARVLAEHGVKEISFLTLFIGSGY